MKVQRDTMEIRNSEWSIDESGIEIRVVVLLLKIKPTTKTAPSTKL